MNRLQQLLQQFKRKNRHRLAAYKQSLVTFFPRYKKKISEFSWKVWWENQVKESKQLLTNGLEQLKKITWVRILQFVLLVTFSFYIAFYLFNQGMLKTRYYDLVASFKDMKGFTYFPYLVSLVGLAYFVSRNFRISFFSRLGLLYLVYLPVSYLVVASQNINNKKFKIWNFADNDFFQTNFLTSLFVIVALAGGYWWFKRRFLQNSESVKECSLFPRATLSLLATIMLLTDSRLGSLLRDSVISNLSISIDTYDFGRYVSDLTSLFILLGLIFFVISWSVLESFTSLRHNKSSYGLAFATSLLLAVIFNFTIQLSLQSFGTILDRFIFPGATLFQIIVLFLFNLGLYMLINRYIVSTLLIIFLGSALSVANNIKMSMRNEPVFYTDLTWLKQIRDLLGYVNEGTVFGLIGALVAFITLSLLLGKRLVKGKISQSFFLRLATLACVLSISLSGLQLLAEKGKRPIPADTPVLATLNNWQNIDWLGQTTVARYKSLMLVWAIQASSPSMQKPKGYTKANIERIATKYQRLADTMNQSRANLIGDRTIIYVLSESLANPSRVPGTSLSTNPLANIDAIKATNTGGLMKSDGYGGGTANMEFQSLTGLPMYNLSSSISSIMTQVALNMTYIPSLSSAYSPENRIAIHLGNADAYSRKEFYDKLHFKTFIARVNGTKNVKEALPIPYGMYPSDTTTYDTVNRTIDSNKSQFFSVITYQNHTPWTVPAAENLASNSELNEGQNKSLNNYTGQIQVTDAATQDWLNYLSQLDKKITVVFYGDHLPGLYPTSVFKSNPGAQYQTDYFIWSNDSQNQLNYPYVNSSDFSAELLATTNSKVSPYYALLTEVLDKASIDKGQLSPEQEKIADDLKLVQYDLVSGKGYLKANQNFFKIPQN